jgi:Fic family protein
VKTIASLIKSTRLARGLKVKELSLLSRIDQALVSKFENGKRIPTLEQVRGIAHALEANLKEFETTRLADKIYELVQYETQSIEALKIAEERVEYLTSKKVFQVQVLDVNLKKSIFRIDALQADWNAKKPLDETQLTKMMEYFKMKYTYDSNRIEGNTLSFQETHLVVNEGITIGGKSMKDHLEAINHAEAVDFITQMIKTNEPLNQRTLLDLHTLVVKGIEKEGAGRYRDKQVMISGSAHMPPEPFLVNQLMEDYFIHYNRQRGVMHPVILAAEMHERLVTIHPFVDGNGRTARLIMNLILLSNGFTIANIKGDLKVRLRYYQALESVQVNNDSTTFYTLICEEVEKSLQEHLALT